MFNNYYLRKRHGHLPMIDEENDYPEVFQESEPKPKEDSTMTTMIQFTKSISAINSMSVGVNVLKAKNAFLRALAIRHLTPADYRREGEIQWKEISENYSPTLVFGNMDFTDLATPATSSRPVPNTPLPIYDIPVTSSPPSSKAITAPPQPPNSKQCPYHLLPLL